MQFNGHTQLLGLIGEEEALIDRTSLVAECVIAPEITALLEDAKRKGCQVHTGIPMLSAQISLMLDFMGVQ
jgi:shikimate dehydrogenase